MGDGVRESPPRLVREWGDSAAGGRGGAELKPQEANLPAPNGWAERVAALAEDEA